MLGTLKFRSSYAQNLLVHSVEVAYLAGLVAGEIGANVKLARRAGLLHDIGRAADQEAEGSHAAVGAQLCRKFGEPPQVVKAVATHHGDEPPETVLDHIVDAANRLSTQRPGARREAMAAYVRRLEDMERLCKSFDGVSRAYAVLMGREVRVMVENERVSDEQALMLCRDIAKKIEGELNYPGQIRISVIRETRAVDYAR
jgi:ribonuclease Y